MPLAGMRTSLTSDQFIEFSTYLSGLKPEIFIASGAGINACSTLWNPGYFVLSVSLTHAAQHQRRILGSEGYAVAHSVLDLSFAAGFGHVVKVAIGIGLFQIDGRGELVVLHGDQRGRHAGGATGSLRVADL